MVDGDRRDERTVARAMAKLAPLTAPDQQERERIRQRVLAGLETPIPRPRTASGGGRAGRAPRRGRSGKAGSTPRGLSGTRVRFAIAAAAVLALLGSLGGMSLLLARTALPGDALYGVKRTAEEATLGLTWDDESKAMKHLEFAAARIDEMTVLANRYPNPADAPVGGYLTALTDFDTDASAGSRALIALGTSGDGSQLTTLHDWALDQRARLTGLAPRLSGTARDRLGRTDELLDRIATRASDLSARMRCYQITSGERDDIGARAATGPCASSAEAPAETSVEPPARDVPNPVPPAEYPPGGMVVPGTEPTSPAPEQPDTPSVPVQPAAVRPEPVYSAPEEPDTVVEALLALPAKLPPLAPGLPAVDLGG
jgi:uncharacterized protein DUF5667